MKHVLKTMAVLAFILCLIVPVFASGSGDSAASSTNPTVIELWFGASVTEAGPPPSDWVAYQIVRDKLNIDLRLTILPSNEKDQDVKILAAGAANALPDMFMVRRDPWNNLYKQGLIANVDSMYAQMPIRTSQQYDKDSIAYTTINGKSYGLASPGVVVRNEGILIRKDWLDKLGLKIPVTLDDYLAVMKAFTEKDPDGNGKKDTYGYGAFIEINDHEEGLGRRLDPFFGAYGVAGTWNLTEKEAGLNIRKSAYFDALSFVKKLSDEKVIDPNWLSYGKDDFRAAWKQGRFGMMREQNAAFAAESNYAPFDKNFPNGEWIVIDPPKGPSGKQSVGVYTQNYRIVAVSAKSAKAGKLPAMARLLEWMSSDEGYFLLGYGVEGVNYVRDSRGVPTVNGIPDPSKGYSKPEMQPLTQIRNLVFYNGEIELLSRYPTYKTATSGKTMSALDVLYDMQKRPWTATVGADTLPVPNADLKRFYEQGVLEFITGKRQLTKENWTAWVADFDKMGGADWDKRGIEQAKTNGLLVK